MIVQISLNSNSNTYLFFEPTKRHKLANYETPIPINE